MELYNYLFSLLGRQAWWPADSPFEVAVGAVLTQNVSWKNVEKSIETLKRKRMMSPQAIAKAKLSHLESLIKASGFYRRKARTLKELSKLFISSGGVGEFFEGETAELRKKLLSIKGIGPETADSILLYAGGHLIFPVDNYTRRLSKKFGICSSQNYEAIRQCFEMELPKDVEVYKEMHALIVEFCKRFKSEC